LLDLKFVHKICLAMMRMLGWTIENTRKYRIQNEEIRLKIRVTPIDEEMSESHGLVMYGRERLMH